MRRFFAMVLGSLLASAAFGGMEKVALSDGSSLNVWIEIPAAGTNAAPLCIVLPPGSGDRSMLDLAVTRLVKPFAERGWAAAAPLSPDEHPFLGTNLEKVPALIAALDTRFGTAGRKLVLAGISNGGIASLELAARNPTRVAAVIAVPGLMSGDAAGLRGMPIYLRIGEKDTWAEMYPQTVAVLQQAGARVDAALVPGSAHDFTPDWQDLERWLKASLGSAYPSQPNPPPTAGGSQRP